MISPAIAYAAGLLPIVDKPLRFAVGPPDGLTSNSWKINATKSGVYVACRDNFKETKVSLHTGGRWRFGFTAEAASTGAVHLLLPGQNRAWEVWDEPKPTLPNQTVIAFKLLFQSSELAVKPEQRSAQVWKKNFLNIEGPPPGKLTVITLFVTIGEPSLQHETEPSIKLASYAIGGNRRLQVIAHGEKQDGYQVQMQNAVQIAKQKMLSSKLDIPEDAYAYFLTKQDDGCRYIFGARMGTGKGASQLPTA